MIELTPSAHQRLDEYLAELRRILRECRSVDATEVERDVRDHIQTALAEAAPPVDVPLLDQVLRTLGAPGDWVDERAVPWFRRPPAEWLADFKEGVVAVAQRLVVGPESYRLPYLSFLAMALGWLVLMMASRPPLRSRAFCNVSGWPITEKT